MLQFNSISIRNFLSIEELDFTFQSGRHIILGRNNDANVTSSNGAGKSSLIEAISYVLYRDYPRKDVCKRGCKDCSVTLDITINGHDYVISKYNNHSSKSGVEITIDGENVTAKGIRQAEKEVISAIGLPYVLFTSSVIIPQGYPVNISQMTPTSRKNIIESLLGLLVWEDYQNIFSSVSKEYEGKYLAIKSQYSDKKENMISLYNRIKGLKEFTEEHLSQIKDQMVSCKADIKKLTQNIDKLSEKIEKISEKSLDSLNMESANMGYNINQLIKKKADIEKSILQGECYTCHKPYTSEEMEKMQSDVTKLSAKIEAMQTSNNATKEIIDKIQEIYYKKTDTTRNLEDKKRELFSLSESFKRHSENDKIPQLEVDLQALNEEVNQIKAELEDIERDKESVAFICSSLLPSSKFRTKLVGSYVQVLNQIIEDVVSLVSPEFEIQLVSSSNEAGIDILIKDKSETNISYYSLSGGEKRRIDVILTLSIQKFLLESSFTNSSLLVFDEIFDNLDSAASNTVLSAINNLFGEEKAIYVISHNDAIKSLFESSIVAEKTNGATYYNLDNYR